MQQAGRRRAPRLPIQLEGSLVGRLACPVKVVDMSLTGCLVQCSMLLDLGAILELHLSLGGEAFVARVRVAGACLDGTSPEEARRYLAGLEFVGLPLEADKSLRRFLNEEKRRQRPAATDGR